jgi:hypothetical protein
MLILFRNFRFFAQKFINLIFNSFYFDVFLSLP